MARLSTRILKKFTSCTRRQTISENDSDAEPEERYPEQNDSGRYTTSTGMKTELEVQNKKNVNLRKEKHDLNQQLARLTHINKQLQNENSVYRRTMLEGSKITEEDELNERPVKKLSLLKTTNDVAKARIRR